MPASNRYKNMSKPNIRMAVLLSGSGRTLQNFIDLAAQKKLKAEIIGVISSKPGVKGLERARNVSIPARVINPREYKDTDSFSKTITDALQLWEPDLIAMAGFLSLYKIPPPFENKVMNIHPALLPAFGGHGYYGERVHRAVLDYGCKVSGCTVHFANNEYDHGPIILQKAVPVTESDNTESLAERVFEAEKEIYPEAINLFAQGKLSVSGRIVKIWTKD